MSVRPSACLTEEGARETGKVLGSKDVEEVKSGGGRITGEQRFDVEIST